ncbi:MAG: tRNA-dihydrouridine synthase family protein [Planctomycetota bacterium]|nr:MAG: tRNA-dihydrouridine synthase family protein [Planctomycetota bacterium]
MTSFSFDFSDIHLPGLSFRPPVLLAPMEGITDPSFRRLILDGSESGAIGGACTEFLRVTQQPLKTEVLHRALGRRPQSQVPVGVQLMGNDPWAMAETARRAADTEAAFVDLNFGCPAPRVFQHGAGSALLDRPSDLARLVEAIVTASPLPVTVKIRSGVNDDRLLETVLAGIEAAGACLVTVHARLKIESYQMPAKWRRLARAVAATNLPIIGNGGLERPEDLEAMGRATGVAGFMIGRAALRNPWIFDQSLAYRQNRSQPQPDLADHARWLARYASAMENSGASPRQALGRLKQAARYQSAQGLAELADRLPTAMRCQDRDDFFRTLGLWEAVPSGEGEGRDSPH